MPRNTRRIKGILAVAVAILVVASAILALIFACCRVSVIEVEGNNIYTSDELIEASKIEYGTFLFGIDKEAIRENVISACSVVRKVDIDRRIHNRVIITVTEEPPSFYSNVGGSTVMFTPDLYVTGVQQNSVEVGAGIKVVLPDVVSAISGENIQFVKTDVSYLNKLLEALSKTDFADRISLINAETSRGMSVIIDGKYTLFPGGTADLDVKFRIASEYLENERIAGAKNATLDLSDPKEVIVTVNNQ